jgi:hypothetical protein
LFNELLEALRGGETGRKSPVAVAKALHLLAPEFFPIWDNKIACKYRCHRTKFERSAEKYFAFCFKMKDVAAEVRAYSDNPADVTILKLIDEYSYAKYTKCWVGGC